ncbi:hypothetical protein HanXRQr2_Chr11g0516721 [Helianthus annuus]|uniref:Uncharacterized protein n=1 Tax=Helianthus annuus TaxID=4232 RepID=A0A251TE09_HELAN|nr:hypothetical protein HanXRQr2_Chr11g0516721 [Helianthus annuus]KAJ0877263.1 hypothetical protein HanPSC8_Chr11g0498081 [Helianthus annuus]
MRIQRLSRSTHVNTLVDVCLMHIFSFLSPVPGLLQMFGSPLLLQMSADVVRRLQTFYLWKNKQHLRSGWTKSAPRRHRTNLF